jgi:hypothetical protein
VGATLEGGDGTHVPGIEVRRLADPVDEDRTAFAAELLVGPKHKMVEALAALNRSRRWALPFRRSNA